MKIRIDDTDKFRRQRIRRQILGMPVQHRFKHGRSAMPDLRLDGLLQARCRPDAQNGQPHDDDQRAAGEMAPQQTQALPDRPRARFRREERSVRHAGQTTHHEFRDMPSDVVHKVAYAPAFT